MGGRDLIKLKLLVLNKALDIYNKVFKHSENYNTKLIEEVEQMKIKIENEIKNINMGD